LYNPVQGGSYKGEDAKTLVFRKTEKELYAKVEPLHWASVKHCPDGSACSYAAPVRTMKLEKGTVVSFSVYRTVPFCHVSPFLSVGKRNRGVLFCL
jgi:hypothetical protein